LVVEDNLDKTNEYLNDDNFNNDDDNILDASNIKVRIDDYFIHPLDIYDPQN